MHSRAQMLTRSLVVTVIAAGSLHTAVAPRASASVPPEMSATLHGIVTGPVGQQVTVPSAVRMFAWEPVGDGSSNNPTMTEIGSTVTDANGAFSLSADAGKVDSYETKFGSPDSINVDVLTFAPDGSFDVFATSLTNASGRDSTTPARSFVASANADDSTDQYSGSYSDSSTVSQRTPFSKIKLTGTQNNRPKMDAGVLLMPLSMQGDAVQPAAMQRLQPTGVNSKATAAGAVVPLTTSNSHRVYNYGHRGAIVGNMNSATAAAAWKASFTYARTASSKLEVDTSSSSGSGYSANGTQQLSSTVTIPYPSFSSSVGTYYFRTYLNYGKYITVYSAGGSTFSYYSIRADGFIGGNPTERQSPKVFSHCQLYNGAGYDRPFQRTSSHATTWTNAVRIGSIDFSAQTGYSGTTYVNYAIAAGNTQLLCGSNGQFTGTPGSTEIRGS